MLWRSPEDEIEFNFNPAVSGMGSTMRRATLTGNGPVRCVVFLIWDPGFQEPSFRFCADLSDLIFQIL